MLKETAREKGFYSVCCCYRQDKCQYINQGALDYRNIKAGECALTETEIKEIQKDYKTDLKGRIKKW